MARRRRPSTSSTDHRDWLTRYIGIQSEFDRQLIPILDDAARLAEKDVLALEDRVGIGAAVRIEQLSDARQSIQRTIRDLWVRVGALVLKGEESAAEEATEQSFAWDEELFAAVFPDPETRNAMKSSLLKTADANVEAMIATYVAGRRPLSEQVYRTQALSSGWVDRRVLAGIARGLNVRELAAEVRDSIKPDVPGGISFAARRLARTEINNAYHASTIARNVDKPWVTDVKWNLSRSHPTADGCDALAAAGPYPKDAVPRKPHPQCLCFVTPETVSLKRFQKEFKEGQYDSWLTRNMQTSSAMVS